MPNTSPAESLLALFAGPERATAIMGDLTEMAATRGRSWFAAAYARTLISLTRRMVLALFVADVGRELMFNLAGAYFRHTPHAWRTTNGPFLLDHMGSLLACIMSTLWFALPFAAVRYGARDRFVQLTFALAAGTTIAFLFIPFASLVCAVATLALAFAAFLSSRWRKPFEVLAWTAAAGFLMIAAVTQGRMYIPVLFGHSHTFIARNAPGLLFQTSLLGVAFVCARMHTLLLEKPPSPRDPTIA
jgi:hypothetical protein